MIIRVQYVYYQLTLEQQLFWYGFCNSGISSFTKCVVDEDISTIQIEDEAMKVTWISSECLFFPLNMQSALMTNPHFLIPTYKWN